MIGSPSNSTHNQPCSGLSIVITCYNLQQYIRESILSVIEQYDVAVPTEIIIVDDASVDNSLEIIQKTIAECGEHLDCTIIRNEQNLGIAGAVNVGFQKAKYDWIIEVDGDDVQCPDRLVNTLRLIEKYPKAVMICLSQICFAYSNRENISMVRHAASREMCGDDDSCCIESVEERFLACQELSKHRITAYGCSMAIKKEIVNRWGNLNTTLSPVRIAQDPAWELRAYLSGGVVGSMLPGVMYRAHDTNILNKAKHSSPIEAEKKIYSMFAACTMHKIADIERALKNCTLTDFDAEQLTVLATVEKNLLQYYHIKTDWWDHTIFLRICILMKNYTILPNLRRRELFLRCLPYRVFSYLKAHRKYMGL